VAVSATNPITGAIRACRSRVSLWVWGKYASAATEHTACSGIIPTVAEGEHRRGLPGLQPAHV
jgi:hypothetical protein